jgi:hypothetical protein
MDARAHYPQTDLTNEPRQMVRRHIIDNRRRQEVHLINCQGRKCLLMPQRESDSSRKCHHYSDTLLGDRAQLADELSELVLTAKG